MTTKNEDKLLRMVTLILRIAVVLLYNYLNGKPPLPTRNSQQELVDEARREILP